MAQYSIPTRRTRLMLTHSVAFGIVGIPVLVITGYSALDTPARDKPSLRAKTTTIRIRIHRSKRTYSFTFFPNMAAMVTQRAFGPRVMGVTVAAVVAARPLFMAQPRPQ